MAGPVLMRARAAARLRARDDLAAAQRRAVRDARGEIGAALRRARRARGVAVEPAGISAPVSLAGAPARGTLRRLAPLAAAAAIAAFALVTITPREPAATAEPGGTPLAAEAAPAPVARESATSRGRSFETVAFAAVAEPTPEPPATPTPAATVAAIPRSSAPRATAGTGTGGGSGSGPGPGGNGVGTSPAPTASAPPPSPTLDATPSPAPTVAPRPPGVTRFVGRVVDSRSGRALSGVCVIVGVRECNQRDVYTDVNGRFTIDLPLGGTWDVNFGRAGYASGYRRLVSSAPRTTDIGTVRLVARP